MKKKNLTTLTVMFAILRIKEMPCKLKALKFAFNIGDEYETKSHLLHDWNMDKYQNLETITEFYFESGMRATKHV